MFRLVRGTLAAPRLLQIVRTGEFHQATVAFKKKGHEKKKVHNPNLTSFSGDDNPVIQETTKEMQRIQEILGEELARHFSPKIDIRSFEEVMVKLETGKEKPLSHIARVSLKSPLMVMINFQDNPTAIKAAKLALQKSNLSVTPQQEGVVLYVNVPPMSKQRREQMAAEAKGRILNEYKKALNEVYSKSDKKSSQEFATRPDEARKTRQALLNLKHAAEQRGLQLIDSKRQELLKQIV
ncbi:unnamed protein product [Caenorhabditis bovis]|uniref:Ribosome-recycling factor, mitochondrial n=1 Tax=Caenorhabditis bovis TaxID=2654633 RepID=A0A8S1F6K6_9PELO|nr:unnamed protein product [Caenorhabditis bovis]